jgi:hypothetical protein
MRISCQLVVVLLGLAAASAAWAVDVAMLSNGFGIRHERHEQKENQTRFYFHAGADFSYVDVATEGVSKVENVGLVPVPPAHVPSSTAPRSVHDLVNAASERHLVDADLIASVIYAESNFNPWARSPKGAQGLMQLMPQTATRLGVKDPFQPEANIDAGSRYLRELLLRYDGDVVKALAAYNAGPERVAQYGGVPPYPETRAYIARVVRDFNCRKQAGKKTSVNKAGASKPAGPRPAKNSASGKQSNASACTV